MQRKVKELNRLLESATSLDIKMFMLKETYRQKIEDKFDVKNVGITNNTKNFLKEVLITNLTLIDDHLDNNQIFDFFDVNGLKSDIYSITSDKIKSFESIINQVNQYSSLIDFNASKDLNRVTSYIIEVKTDQIQRILFFIRFTKKQILIKKTLSLRNNEFNTFEGDIFFINDLIDCIYFDIGNSSEPMIISNKTNFENIFRFRDYYTSVACKTIDSTEFKRMVELSDDVKDSVKKIGYAKKITHLIRTWNIDDNLKTALFDSKDKFDKLNYDTSTGKIYIKDEKGLTDFMDIWEDNIAKTLAFNQCCRIKEKKRT